MSQVRLKGHDGLFARAEGESVAKRRTPTRMGGAFLSRPLNNTSIHEFGWFLAFYFFPLIVA
jgi:hypothetical protein